MSAPRPVGLSVPGNAAMYCRICKYWKGQQFKRCHRYLDEDSNCMKRREVEVLKLIREAERLMRDDKVMRPENS